MINLTYVQGTDEKEVSVNLTITERLFEELDNDLDAVLKIFKDRIEDSVNTKYKAGYDVYLYLPECENVGDTYYFEYEGKQNGSSRAAHLRIYNLDLTKEEILAKFTKPTQVAGIHPFYEERKNND